MLTEEERAELKTQFEDYKATKAKAFRVSIKSRINDTTHTVQAIESEVSLAVVALMFYSPHMMCSF